VARRIIVLDSGPLGLACGNPSRPEVSAITIWWSVALANGALVVLPEIADYEVRRGLILDKKKKPNSAGVQRLDKLKEQLLYVPITTGVMRRAAELWADARYQGSPTAADEALDADVIVAAQAMHYAGLGDTLTVATDNVRHLSRFLDARKWEAI
jgi:predicted nucleic acid-binding protein